LINRSIAWTRRRPESLSNIEPESSTIASMFVAGLQEELAAALSALLSSARPPTSNRRPAARKTEATVRCNLALPIPRRIPTSVTIGGGRVRRFAAIGTAGFEPTVSGLRVRVIEPVRCGDCSEIV
jgi:hypothetical protein